MSTNKKLKKALLIKLDITPQALSQRVKKKKVHCPMTTEDATYLIAHEEGIKLDKFLDGGTIAHVRTLLSAGVSPVPRVNSTTKKSSKKSVSHEIRFPNEFRTVDPVVPRKRLDDAAKMAQIYPLLYVLENSLREVIKRVMSSKHGKNWWDIVMVSGKLKTTKQNAENRKLRERALVWHQPRGEHDIDYVDLADLESIVTANQADFIPHIISPDREWFTQFMRDLVASRNVVCHMNRLIEINVNDLKVKIERWNKMIQANLPAIPVTPAEN